jgi:hypothetical protein
MEQIWMHKLVYVAQVIMGLTFLIWTSIKHSVSLMVVGDLEWDQ